jgi:hypothetical protein
VGASFLFHFLFHFLENKNFSLIISFHRRQENRLIANNKKNSMQRAPESNAGGATQLPCGGSPEDALTVHRPLCASHLFYFLFEIN